MIKNGCTVQILSSAGVMRFGSFSRSFSMAISWSALGMDGTLGLEGGAIVGECRRDEAFGGTRWAYGAQNANLG